jgi:hypothetical protein
MQLKKEHIPLKQEYNTKEDLLLDIVEKQGIPSELSISGINKDNCVTFDVNINKKQLSVSQISEIVGKANFIDRYYQSSSYLVKK